MSSAVPYVSSDEYGESEFTERVLIADDDAASLLLLKGLLRRQGCDVITAKNGQEAVDACIAQMPDFILLDISMPVMDGYDAAARIKAFAGDAFVPIIFLTAITDESALAKCVEAGGDDFLTKPYSSAILEAKIKALRRTRELYNVVQRQVDQLAAHQERLQSERKVARNMFDGVIQRWPNNLDFMRWKLSPHSLFSGDMLLVGKTPGGAQNIMLGDFTGHGLSAAVGSIPAADVFYGMTKKGFHVRNIIEEMNKRLVKLLPANMFCSAALVSIDPVHGTISIFNGGLPPVLITDGQGEVVHRSESNHLPLGISKDYEVNIQVLEYDVNERIYMYSDGITEMEMESGEMLGQERLEALIREAGEGGAFDYLNEMVQHCHQARSADDDVTYIELIPAKVMDESIAPSDSDSESNESGEWRLVIDMGAQSLRRADPLPILVNAISEVQGLSNHRSNIFTILSELFNNALEHGILHLDSSMKDSAEGFAQYYEERHSRLEKLDTGYIAIQCCHTPTPHGGRLNIQVENGGTDMPIGLNEPSPSKERSNPYSGRGLALVQSLCESVEVNPIENSVTAIYAWNRNANQ